MTTAIRSSSIGTAASGTAVSTAVPAGTAVGDKVLVLINANNVTTIADNNGANALTVDPNVNQLQLPSNGMTTSMFLKTVTSGDLTAWGGTLQFTIGTSGRWTAIAVAVDSPAASFYDVSPATASDDGFPISGTSPSITTLTANAIHVAFMCVDGSSTGITPPAGYTVAQNGGNEAACVCSKVIATPAATGAQSFGFTSTEGYISGSFAIAPAGAPAPQIDGLLMGNPTLLF